MKPPAPRVTAPAAKKVKPQEQTFEEPKYLKKLIEREITVCVKLINNETVTGRIEFYDSDFIRITREDAPNLFIYKHDIKYLYEADPAAAQPSGKDSQ